MSSERVLITEPSSGVIQSPDGEIQYYTNIQNKHNPYLQNSPLDEEANSEYVEIECDGQSVAILATDVNKAVELECRACVVRVLCLVDFLFNVFISFAAYYMTLFSILIAGISYMGYRSTITYNKNGLIFLLSSNTKPFTHNNDNINIMAPV